MEQGSGSSNAAEGVAADGDVVAEEDEEEDDVEEEGCADGGGSACPAGAHRVTALLPSSARRNRTRLHDGTARHGTARNSVKNGLEKVGRQKGLKKVGKSMKKGLGKSKRGKKGLG